MPAKVYLTAVLVVELGLMILFTSSSTHSFRHFVHWIQKRYYLGDSLVDLMLFSIVRVFIVALIAIACNPIDKTKTSDEEGSHNGMGQRLLDPVAVDPAASFISLPDHPIDKDKDPTVLFESLYSKKKKVEEKENTKKVAPRSKRQRRLLLALSIVSFLFLLAKALARLISTTVVVEAESATWFWVSVIATFLFSCVHYIFVPWLLERKNDDKKDKSQSRAKEILALCAPDWYVFVTAFTGLVAAAAGESLIPLLFGHIINAIAIDKDEVQFHKYMGLLVLTAGITGIFTGIRGSSFSLGGSRFSARIRQRLFDSLLRQDMAFFDKTKTGELTSRLSADCQKVADQVVLNVNVFLRSVLQAIFTLVLMVYINWRLALTAFISVPSIVVVSKIFGEYISVLNKASQSSLADATSVAEETMSTMKTVRSHAGEVECSKRFSVELGEYIRILRKEAAAYCVYAGLTFTFLPYCTSCLVLFYGGKLCKENELNNGELVSFVFYMQSLFNAFNSLASVFSGLVTAMAASAKVFEWIARQPEWEADPNALDPANESVGDIKFERVNFSYPTRPDRPVLRDFTLHCKPGEVVALCGPSGGGKSSVIGLLQHYYEPATGQVLLDGVSVNKLSPSWLHRQVGLVSQEPVLYGRSIKENILFGYLDAEKWDEVPTMADVVEAAKRAHVHDFIISLPAQYDTEVGERGAQLSGGQKQRIAIARALVRKPKVLLLDEATSALDAESEATVQQAIDLMIAQGNMTVIVIAHRLSTIRNATKIIVIQQGKVVEQGSHDELVQKGGEYNRLVTRQLAGGAGGGTVSASASAIGFGHSISQSQQLFSPDLLSPSSSTLAFPDTNSSTLALPDTNPLKAFTNEKVQQSEDDGND